MRKGLLFVFTLMAVFAFGQTDCRSYVPTSKGDVWEVTNYSPKDKVTGKTKNELVSVVETDSSSIFTIKATSYDDKGEEVYVNTFTAECTDGVFKFDMEMTLNGTTMQAYKDMEVEVDGTEFEIPPTDTSYTGTLADGELNLKVSTNGMAIMNMKVLVYDRKVDGIEQVTTTAGTFNCVKLSQKVRMKMVMNIEASSKEWYCEGVGMIRSESYNKKGKLTGYTVLTSLVKK